MTLTEMSGGYLLRRQPHFSLHLCCSLQFRGLTTISGQAQKFVEMLRTHTIAEILQLGRVLPLQAGQVMQTPFTGCQPSRYFKQYLQFAASLGCSFAVKLLHLRCRKLDFSRTRKRRLLHCECIFTIRLSDAAGILEGVQRQFCDTYALFD